MDIVKEFLKEEKPDLIFLPHTADSHPTHRAVLETILESLQQIFIEDRSNLISSSQSKVQSSCNMESAVLSTEMGFGNPSVLLFMYEGPWSLFQKGSYNTIFSPSLDHFARKQAAIKEHKSQTGRTPYDVAADSLAQLRAALVPEQDLAGFGAEPPKLEPKVELFFCQKVSSTQHLQPLFKWFRSNQPPRSLQ